MAVTLSEAIKILEKERNDHHSYPTDIIGQAEELGIKALKAIQTWRISLDDDLLCKLPGEAEE